MPRASGVTLTIAVPSQLEREALGLVAKLHDNGTPATVLSGDVGAPTALARLHSGEADCVLAAAESVRDLPDDLAIRATLEREEPRDVLVAAEGRSATLTTLESGARVGVGSLRRRGFLMAHRRDVIPVPPGNGEGPVAALRSGSVDAIVLGQAEARRLALAPLVCDVLDVQAWVPAPGQGTLVVVCRQDDDDVARLCAPLDHPLTGAALRAEWAAFAAQGFDGDIPLGTLAILHGSWIRVWGMAASPDGGQVVRGDVTGRADDPEGAGRSLADLLVARGVVGVLRSAWS